MRAPAVDPERSGSGPSPAERDGPATFKVGSALAAGHPRGRRLTSETHVMRYTRFERARIIGARALQISMGAPILLETPPGVVDPIELADLEFRKAVIPITVKRD